MRGINMMYRVEDKYFCSTQEMFCLQKRLGNVLQSDSYENSVEGYSISSLYFDDLRESSLINTREGNRSRCKYRIRIYNNSLNVIKLEVKEKYDNRIYKKSKSIREDELQKLMQGECIDCAWTRDDPAMLFNLAIQIQGLRPRVIVAYERKAFVYGPGNVRITLDRNIRSSRQIQQFGNSNISYDYLKEQDEIVEIKYDELIPGFLLQMLQLENMQQTAYSKYQLCRENIN
jgi:hypothetical protein